MTRPAKERPSVREGFLALGGSPEEFDSANPALEEQSQSVGSRVAAYGRRRSTAIPAPTVTEQAANEPPAPPTTEPTPELVPQPVIPQVARALSPEPAPAPSPAPAVIGRRRDERTLELDGDASSSSLEADGGTPEDRSSASRSIRSRSVRAAGFALLAGVVVVAAVPL